MSAYNVYLPKKLKDHISRHDYKSISFSRVVKWMIASIVLTEKELREEKRKKPEEYQEVKNYLESIMKKL
jgi:hypothetical protein